MLVENEAGSLTTVTWGYEDEVLTVTQPNGTLVTMTYDGDLKRRKRAQANWWNSYLWDREQVVLELDKNDNTIARYTLAPFGYGDLVSQRRSDTTSFFHFDAIGTTRALTDTDQDVTDSYIMRAFGTYRASSGSTVNNFRYIGKLGYYRKTALSGFYLRRRYYAPDVGRFVSRDPVREAGVSEYLYVQSRPTRLIDPSGRQGAGPDPGTPWPGPLWPPPVITVPRRPLDPYRLLGKCGCAAHRAAEKASGVSSKSGLPGSQDGPQDAFRHCILMCEMTRSAGALCAKLVAWQHEFFRPNPPCGAAMDRFNNEKSLQIARRPGACEDVCMSALRNNELVCCDPPNSFQVPMPCVPPGGARWAV